MIFDIVGSSTLPVPPIIIKAKAFFDLANDFETLTILRIELTAAAVALVVVVVEVVVVVVTEVVDEVDVKVLLPDASTSFPSR